MPQIKKSLNAHIIIILVFQIGHDSKVKESAFLGSFRRWALVCFFNCFEDGLDDRVWGIDNLRADDFAFLVLNGDHGLNGGPVVDEAF